MTDCRICAASECEVTMSQQQITRFFKPTVPVRQEQVPTLPKSTLDRANEAVVAVQSGEASAQARTKKRGRYGRVDHDTKFKIGKFAAEHGDANAVRKFANAVPNLKVTTVRDPQVVASVWPLGC
jgi:hypothetical protein